MVASVAEPASESYLVILSMAADAMVMVASVAEPTSESYLVILSMAAEATW